MKIQIDRTTRVVESIYGLLTPLMYELDVLDTFTLIKDVPEVQGQIQKEIDGQKIYRKPVQTVSNQRVLVGKIKTTEPSEEPCYFIIPKTVDGQELYYGLDGAETTDAIHQIHVPLQPVMEGDTQKTLKTYNESGEITGELLLYYKPIGFSLVETTEYEMILEQELQPIMKQIPEVDESGNPLYWNEQYETREIIINDFEEVVYSEDLDLSICEPVMIDDIKMVTKDILRDPKCFTADDIPLDAIREWKIKELSDACNQTITSGYVSSVISNLYAHGEPHLYDFEVENQLNMFCLHKDAKDGLYPDGVPYYYKGGQCDVYPLDQFEQLYQEGALFKLTTTQRYKGLKEDVLNTQTIEEVYNIKW